MRLMRALLASTFTLAVGGEAQLLPAGEFAARDGRPGPGKVWRIDDAAGQALAAKLSAVAAKTPVVIDYDHQTLYVAMHGQKAPAAGWINSARWVDGAGLFAEVEWTAAAAQDIEKREYRYISPVISYEEETGRVVAVELAALVNFPALTGMHAAVAHLAAQHTNHLSTETRVDLKQLCIARGLAEGSTEQQALSAITELRAAHKPTLPAALATQLGVAVDADAAAIATAVANLAAGKAGAEASVLNLQTQFTALQTQLNERERAELIDAALAAHKIVPAQVATLKTKDIAFVREFLAASVAVPGLAGQSRAGGHDTGAGGAADVQPAMLAAEARLYQSQQAAAGIDIGTTAAVDHVIAVRAKAVA
jgi:phage I-like protein